jgi:DNA segregation ATPase FtsK/SpoIIIE-like protein
MIRSLMNERQEKLSAATYASLEDYNAQHRDNPDVMFPAILVVIDNFAEFKENYEYLTPDLLALVRDGRQFGIYFLLTANSPADIPGKLFNLLGQRLSFTLADPGAIPDIVGRGALSLANVPGRGLINIEGQPLEFQVAVPVLENEKDSYARLAERMDKAWAAVGGKRPSAEIPRAVTLLEMMARQMGRKLERVGDLDLAGNWTRSMEPKNQEWLRGPVGLISSKELRTMIFSAQSDGDGVHGMVAGTTGSGKSEFLQTLIASLAIKYDPRIVNFVLIDYKGGAAFEPFRQLPHTVDIATNLEGNAVERIFIAVKAEMDRRSDLLAKSGVAELVKYRKEVIPRGRKDLPETFPHLFIIVDEFAEMIATNPDYRLQFESITRLGRAFGVTLILATQRPAGAVSDQMRANMKFRVCLRVETADDSKELLKRPDAAMLPPIPGRGYIQVGGGPLTELQSAYSGNDYTDDKPDPVYSTDEILAALGVSEDLKPTKLINWIVGSAAAEANRQNIPKQFKPWPDPLPKQLPLNRPVDASYIAKGKLGKEVVLNPKVTEWLSGNAAWAAPAPQATFTLTATLGVIDNPYLSEQRLLTIDLSGDPLAVFGASGRGKTMFLKSLILALAVERSPADLHIYALDFGRGGLKAFRNLPHMGGIVDVGEEERVERLIRMIRTTIDERQQKMQAFDSLTEFNQKNPQSAFAPVLVVIDNVSEFKETYERYLPDLLAMVRDGRSFGVYFVVTATLPNDIPLKLFNLLNQRITFTQSDPSEYTTLVGRGWGRFNDEPGRGLAVELVGDAPVPLEFQTAVPVGETEADQYRELAQKMAQTWEAQMASNAALRTKRARPVEPLPTLLDLASVLKPLGEAYANKAVAVGVNDLDREPTLLEFGNKGPHLIVVGPPVTGKTTTMRSLALSLAHSYGPEQAALILVDPSDASRRFYNYGGSDGRTLADLPHVLGTVGSPKEFDALVKRLRAEYDEEVIGRLRGNLDVFAPQDNAARSIFLLFDHYDDAETFSKGSEGLNALAEIGKGKNLHLVICGSSNIMRNSADEVRRRAEQARYTLILQDFEAVRYMGARGNFNVANKELPPGRGFLVKAVSAALVHMALPVVEGKGGQTAEEQLDRLIGEIQWKWSERARWSYFAEDLAPLEAAIRGETVAAPEAAPPPPPSDAMAELAKLLASQTSSAQSFFTSEISEGSNFASVEIPEEKTGDEVP